VEEISKRVVSNGERFLVSSLNLTLEIVDRLFNAYQTDLPRKVDFVGGIERCKSRYVLVDDKPETTRHSTCNKP
jgi:hypothetical protein